MKALEKKPLKQIKKLKRLRNKDKIQHKKSPVANAGLFLFNREIFFTQSF